MARKEAGKVLSEIRKMFEQQKTISLCDLCAHFDVEESAMEKMLEFWQAKDKLKRKEEDRAQCIGCSDVACPKEKVILYEWQEDQ